MINSLFKNFVSLSGAEVFCKAITFVAFAYLARVCGASGFGYIEWSAAVLMCASSVVDIGFSAYGAREIAKQPLATAKLVREIVTARFLLAAFSYAAIAAFGWFFVSDRLIFRLLLIYGISLWALPLLLQWVFQGHDRMNVVAITQVIRQSVFVAVVIAFVRAPTDILFVGFAEVAAVIAAAIFSVVMVRRYLRGVEHIRPMLSAEIFREGVPIGLSQMFWVGRMFGATLILGLFATAEDTGFFAAAMRIFIALYTFVWLYYFNLLPTMSRAWVESRSALQSIISSSMRIVLPASFFIAFVWIIAARFVMTTAYGAEFSRGSSALQWLACAWLAATVSGHFRFGLIAAGNQNKELLSSVIGTTLAAVLIPVGYVNAGPGGAAAGLFAAETIVFLACWYFMRGTAITERAENEPHFESMPEVAGF